MDKAEKTKESWQERKMRIKYKWLAWFIYPEWLCERVSYFLGHWALLDICDHIARLGVLVSIIVGMCVYVMEADDRQMEAENQRKAKHYQAWQAINAAQGKLGSAGRIDALQDLNRDKVSLAYVYLSNAELRNIKLESANLSYAKFLGTDLRWAHLERADFSGADFRWANLSEAHLERADLSGTDLTGVDFSEADLTDIKKWQQIKSIKYANIYNVSAPKGFKEWAIAPEQGAVSFEDKNEWKKLIREREKQEEDNNREGQKK